MTCRRRVPWPTGLAFALVALVVSSAPAQEGEAPQGKVRVPPHGVQGFVRLLHELELQPVASIDELLKSDPQDRVVIIFGDPAPLEQLIKDKLGVADLIQNEGALLIACDRPTHQLLEDLEVRIVGDVVSQSVTRDPYKGLKDCPLIKHVAEKHPLFQGVQRLATINPSQVCDLHQGMFLSRLAFFPDGSMSSERFHPGAAFIVGSDATSDPPSKRRIVVMGGHSPFMNVLLVQPDIDNRAFAENTVRWLTDHGRRKRCLFIYDGTVATSFDVPLGGIPMPTEELINRFLARMEQEGFFEKLAARIVPRGLVLHALFYGTTLFLAIYLFFRVWGKRHDIPREAPLLSAKVAQAVPEKTVLALRQEALTHEDNLWEVARALCRQCFERHGLGAPDPAVFPVVRASGPHFGRRARMRRVLGLWKLAYGKPGRAVRARDFARLLADVEVVDGWLAEESVRLEFPPRPGRPRPARVSPEVSLN